MSVLTYGIEIVNRSSHDYCIPIKDEDENVVRWIRRTKEDVTYVLLRDADGRPITFDDRDIASQFIGKFFRGQAEIRQIYA